MHLRSALYTAAATATIVAATALPAAAAPAAPLTTSIGARPASAASAQQPYLTKRNIYLSQSGCEFAGWWGQLWGNWFWFTCLPRRFPQDPQLWWQLVTNP